MDKGQKACPSCGAQVFPEEAKCPVCGHQLRAHAGRFLVGVMGTLVALLAGAGVWWVLSMPVSSDVTPPERSSSGAAVSSEPEPVVSAGETPPTSPRAAPPAWPQNGGIAEPAAPDAQAAPPSQMAPTEPSVPATVEERRAFAKESEASLTGNGLEVSVSTSGEEHKTLVMTFNYPATTTAELIVAGPFPRQCERRGFTRILFVDPGESTLVYDIATQTLSSR